MRHVFTLQAIILSPLTAIMERCRSIAIVASVVSRRS